MLNRANSFTLWVLVGAWLFCGIAASQDQGATPELRVLERYLGTWQYSGEDKTPGTGGAVTCTSTRRWISAGHFVESHRECKTPRGSITQVEVFGYDSRRGRYVYWGFNGSVASSYSAPSMSGDTI